MKFTKLAAGIALATISAGALAGGPLYIHDKTMQPYKWDTSKGSIPVWVDGGPLIKDKDGNDVQTFTVIEEGTNFGWRGLTVDVHTADGQVIPKGTKIADKDYIFLTVEDANRVTADAVAEWTNVETSTFAMDVRGSIESQIGIVDVTDENVDQIYGTENGYGFWVNYDTDGAILENYFGIARNMVLGIAFPEWADEETGEITEATALMNGWFVDVSDTEGKKVGGVFTHEFGHAINMSHSQANGHLAYMASAWNPQYDGVPGCEGVNVYKGSRFTGSVLALDGIETMFPFIDVRGDAGANQHTVNVTDDKVNISDLYPTAEYKTQYGSISGTLYTKEGVEYSGVNLIARNLDNPYEDVISQQSGNMTQGKMGPDGKFTINGLTPGARYALYTQEIHAGGYPTQQTAIISESEYWNEGESSNPGEDNACKMTEIVVAAGETKELEMHFNGYTDGIQYTPLAQAYIVDHAKNGKKALGSTASGIPFIYDSNHNTFETVLNDEGMAVLSSTNMAMNKTATKAAVVADLDGNGIGQVAVWDIRSNKVEQLHDITNNTCHLSSQQGQSSNSVWDMDDSGQVIVGTSRLPNAGGETCAEGEGHLSFAIPTVWDTTSGDSSPLLDKLMVAPKRWGTGYEIVIVGEDNNPDTEVRRTAWIRADRVSGNGEVVTGTTNGNTQVAWIDGKLRDIYTEFGARDSAVLSTDGSEVAFHSQTKDGRFVTGNGIRKWNTKTDEITDLGSLRWCDDIPFIQRWTNYCEPGRFQMTHEELVPLVGLPGMVVLDATEDLSVITARAGSPLAGGFIGAIYMEGIGWMTNEEFFTKQGVVEAKGLLTDNIFGLSANGSEMMAGIAGLIVSIDVDANKAFVCDKGVDKELSFPKQVVAAVKKGAEFGRCAHIND